MLQRYSIRDKYFNNYEWGILTYDNVKKQGTIDFNPDGVNHYAEMPITMEVIIRNGQFHLTEAETWRFIASRVCPPERPGCMAEMYRLGETEYNPIALYLSIDGETDTDCTYVVRIE